MRAAWLLPVGDGHMKRERGKARVWLPSPPWLLEKLRRHEIEPTTEVAKNAAYYHRVVAIALVDVTGQVFSGVEPVVELQQRWSMELMLQRLCYRHPADAYSIQLKEVHPLVQPPLTIHERRPAPLHSRKTTNSFLKGIFYPAWDFDPGELLVRISDAEVRASDLLQRWSQCLFSDSCVHTYTFLRARMCVCVYI